MESRHQRERREVAHIEKEIREGKTTVSEAPSDSEYIRDTYEETKSTRRLTRWILWITFITLAVAVVSLVLSQV
jgi:hypothetical protein